MLVTAPLLLVLFVTAAPVDGAATNGVAVSESALRSCAESSEDELLLVLWHAPSAHCWWRFPVWAEGKRQRRSYEADNG